MDKELDAHMDRELEQYYDNYWDLFASNGWKQFVQEVTEACSSVNDITAINDANEFFFRKGKVEVYNQLLNFKDMIERSYAELQNG
jgi:hypothetical protein